MALDYASIGLRIKHARTQRGMAQEKMAELLGISRTQIGYIETGERGISLELLVNIANTLHVPIAELLADNLTDVEKVLNSDLGYILLDCTEQEERIITRTAKALKEILSAQGI